MGLGGLAVEFLEYVFNTVGSLVTGEFFFIAAGSLATGDEDEGKARTFDTASDNVSTSDFVSARTSFGMSTVEWFYSSKQSYDLRMVNVLWWFLLFILRYNILIGIFLL